MFWYWVERQKYWCSPWIFWGHCEWSDVVKAALRRLAPKQDLDSQATWSMAQSVLRSSSPWRLGNTVMAIIIIAVSESCLHGRSTVAPPWKVRLWDSSPPPLFKPFSFTTTFKKVLHSFKRFWLFKKISDFFQKGTWLFQNKCVSHRSRCCSTESCSVLSLLTHVYDQELKKTKEFIIFAFTWQT